MRTARFWNNLHQVRWLLDWKSKHVGLNGQVKKKNLNKTAKIGLDYFCLREIALNSSTFVLLMCLYHTRKVNNQNKCVSSIEIAYFYDFAIPLADLFLYFLLYLGRSVSRELMLQMFCDIEKIWTNYYLHTFPIFHPICRNIGNDRHRTNISVYIVLDLYIFRIFQGTGTLWIKSCPNALFGTTT